MKGETEMGFNNGYDSGYSDAIDDVRNGKVAGLGPASGGGGATPAPAPVPTYMTNAANRYATVTEGLDRVRYAAPESVTAAVDGVALDLQVPTDVPAGTVMNVNLAFEYTSQEDDEPVWGEVSGSTVGVYAITVNGVALSGTTTSDMSRFTGLSKLVLWYDGASWVCMADEGVVGEDVGD